MKHLFTLLLLFLSFNASSGITVTDCVPSSQCQTYNASLGYCGDNIEECKSSFDGIYTNHNGSFRVTTLRNSGTNRLHAIVTQDGSSRQASEFYLYVNDTGSGCHSAEECYQQATRECTSISQELKDFTYLGNDSDPNYTKQCSTQQTDQQKCEESIIAQCVNNFGASQINYTQDGSRCFLLLVVGIFVAWGPGFVA